MWEGATFLHIAKKRCSPKSFRTPTLNKPSLKDSQLTDQLHCRVVPKAVLKPQFFATVEKNRN